MFNGNLFLDGWGRQISHDLFKYIIGYDDLKYYFRMALTTPDPISAILIGPPASAKSLFLDALETIGGRLITGSGLTQAGLIDVLVDENTETIPGKKGLPILLFDEMEKVKKPRSDLAPLLTWIESGRVILQIHDKKRATDFKTDLKKWMVVAACNSLKGIPKEVLSRFDPFFLKQYTRDEFDKVVVQVLQDKEGVDKSLAISIAGRLIDERRYEVREAIRICRLIKYQENPMEALVTLMRVKNKYSRRPL